MSNFTKYNRKQNKNINWNVNTDGMAWAKLSELVEGMNYPVHGIFINRKSQYGATPVVITSGCLVSLPQRYVEQFEEILSDDDAINEIMSGAVGFSYSKGKTKGGREFYNFEFN